MAHQEHNLERTQIKQKFRSNGSLTALFFPPKWNLNNQTKCALIMDDRTLKAMFDAADQRHRARTTGDYDLARQWARSISTAELEKELSEAEHDLKPVVVARIGGRVVKVEPVPPYKVNWARALLDELVSRFDRENFHELAD